MAQDLAVGGEDAHVEIGDEYKHRRSFVGAPDADVMQATGTA